MSAAGGAFYQQSFEKKCTIQQLTEVLRIYNYFPEELDVKFLATQYIISGRTSEIHYQKLIDDIKNAERAAAGTATATGDPVSICGAIKKQLHILGMEAGRYMQENAAVNTQRGSYNQQELVLLIG